MTKKKVSVGWVLFQRVKKHRMRYPTDEEIEQAINELERLEEDE